MNIFLPGNAKPHLNAALGRNEMIGEMKMKLFCIMYAVRADNGSRIYSIAIVKQEYGRNQRMKGVDWMGNPKYCYMMVDEETATRLRKTRVQDWGIELPR